MKGNGSMASRLLIALVMGALLAACSGTLRYTPKGANKATGADALILADVDEGASMTKLEITVEFLPPPDRIEAGGTTFVVWARLNSSSPWQRVGGLAYDADNRKGELKGASVPMKQFELIVTAEKTPDSQSPSPGIVLQQIVSDD
jgi:hypothetical protein